MNEEELKTLKDLEKYARHKTYIRKIPTQARRNNGKTNNEICVIEKKELKAEAVKWVKERLENPDWYNRDWTIVFKEFFNLTEEELGK